MNVYSIVYVACWVFSLYSLCHACKTGNTNTLQKGFVSEHQDHKPATVKEVREEIKQYEAEKEKLETELLLEEDQFKKDIRDDLSILESEPYKNLLRNLTATLEEEVKLHQDLNLEELYNRTLVSKIKEIETRIKKMDNMRRNGDLAKCNKIVRNSKRPRGLLSRVFTELTRISPLKINANELQRYRDFENEKTKLEFVEQEDRLLLRKVEDVKAVHDQAIDEVHNFKYQNSKHLSDMDSQVRQLADTLHLASKRVWLLKKHMSELRKSNEKNKINLERLEDKAKEYTKDEICYKKLRQIASRRY